MTSTQNSEMHDTYEEKCSQKHQNLFYLYSKNKIKNTGEK